MDQKIEHFINNNQRTDLKIESDPLNHDDFNNYIKEGYQIDKSLGESQQKLEFPPQNSSTNYYQEYCRLYITNVAITTQIKELLKTKQELKEKLDQFEVQSTSTKEQQKHNEKKKRSRRSAQDINRHYKCLAKNCPKSYGSEGSLNQHLKLKHPEMHAQLLEKLMKQNKDNEDELNQQQNQLS